MKPGAAGGLPSEFPTVKYAKGGIMSYDMGGEVESQLESMDEKGLQAQARESSSPSIRKMAQRLLRERQMSKPQGADAANVQYQAAGIPSMRSGGIIAFATGGGANEEGGEDEAKIGMQERLATPAPTTGGIMGATTQPTTPIPFAPTAGRAVQQTATIPDFMKAEYADTEKRMNAPLSSFMAERQAAMREAGVADTSEGQQQQRAEMMAEKANMADEKQRQKYMRLAEFFASWGSTPGPTLVAGLNAMQKTVPNIISDEKEQKKARREIDKSIADLDNATRLEKRGEVDAAMALKLKAAEDMKALNMKFIDYQSRRESDISSSAASKYTADMHLRGEEIRAATARLDRAARRETDDDNKRFGQYQTAAQQEQRLISKIADQAKMFNKEYDTIKTAEMNAAANDGVMTPALVPGYETAKKKIADQETIWNKQKEQAARDTELAYKRVRVRPEEAAKDYTKPTGGAAPEAAPSAGSVSGEFSAPTQAHIAALRSNPTQAAAFDAKFGPGAANEYLGK
jgi:ribosomal protein L18E